MALRLWRALLQIAEIRDDLPPLLFGQRTPRRHSIPETAVAQQPLQLAVAGMTHTSGDECGMSVLAQPTFTMALGAVLLEELAARSTRCLISHVGVRAGAVLPGHEAKPVAVACMGKAKDRGGDQEGN